jgi:hypothetical protein
MGFSRIAVLLALAALAGGLDDRRAADAAKAQDFAALRDLVRQNNPVSMEKLAKINTFHVEQLAYFDLVSGV